MRSPVQWIAVLLFVANCINAQTNLTLPLWPDGASDALGKEAKDIPTITVFLPKPENATGAAMIICPGGGYQHLAEHEGSHHARWLNEQGIAGFVLKYRLGSSGYRHPTMMNDAARAIRIVRARAQDWKLDTQRIGIMGSSAGGHLASTLLTHWDNGDTNSTDIVQRHGSRPDIAILCYPVITMTDPFTHRGSRANLLGTNPPPDLVKRLSAETQVNKSSPPCFIWSAEADKTVPVENSLQLAAALRREGVRFELHVYDMGGHGVGLGNKAYDKDKFHPWTRDCEAWLKKQRFGR